MDAEDILDDEISAVMDDYKQSQSLLAPVPIQPVAAAS